MAQGWNEVDADPGKAAVTFKKAVDKSPGDVEANYGYGYALLLSGQTDAAVKPLCKARNTTQADILQDVNGLLASRQLSCP